MKYIKKPESIKINDVQEFGLGDFIVWVVGVFKDFNENGAGIRAGIRAEDAVTRDADKHYVELTPEVWALLNRGAESPGVPYPVLEGVRADGARIKVSLARECLRFIDAIAEAKDEPPPKPEETVVEATPVA